MLEKVSSRRRSIFSRLLLPMLIIAVAEMAALFLTLSIGGAFSTMTNSALDALDERTQNKQQPLQQEFRTIWSNLDTTASSLARIIETGLRSRGATTADMAGNPSLNSYLVEDMAPTVLSRFRTLGTTGIFVILDGQGVAGQPDSYAGIYLRDSDPNTESSDNRDVLLTRGLPPRSEQLGIPLDRDWEAAFSFREGEEDGYYFMPFESAVKGGGVMQEYAYWCGPFRMQPTDPDEVLTYSMPLMSSRGEVYGVVGIELSQTYLSNEFNSGEFARTVPGSYLMGTLRDSVIDLAVTSGQTYRQNFRQDRDFVTVNEWIDDDSVSFVGSLTGKTVYGTVLDMTLYPTPSQFSDAQWVLIGLQSEESLMASSNRFLMLMVVGGIVALMVCVFVAVITSRSLTRPISRMVHQVREGSNASELHLDPTGMVEIDELGDSILRLSRDVHESASRLSTILHLTGMAVGVFELKFDSDTAYCSSGFFQLLECEEDAHLGENLPKQRLYQIMREKLTDQVETDVWRLRSRTGEERYVRRVQLQHRYDLLGAIMDVTSEIEDRRRIEHERDYDILTGLLNRRAFTRTMEELFRKPERLGVAAMIMMDLDNLKFINDTHGHDCGDNYIRSFGEALVEFDEVAQCVRGRRSGDEFYVLLYGFKCKEDCIEAINTAWQNIMQRGIDLPDGQFFRFRCSGGVAWYPDDSKAVDTLVQYADFAMYRVKQGSKGVLEFFDHSVYSEESFLLNGREALNNLIDKHLIRFAFQPIVDAHTGEIFGYELLMRPDVPELRNPAATLRLAKAQGLLHHIERLTWFEGLKAARVMRESGQISKDARIFINSIANQVLDHDEEEYIIKRFPDLLANVTLEVTESEDNNMAYTHQKLEFIRQHGGMVAIDDYGTGYNSEMALMLIDADVVKIDISFVRNVDSDPDKQQLVRNLISYARRKNIMVLGEGVETRAEMETLIAYGIDYLQGYHLGKPSFDPPAISAAIREEILQATVTPPQKIIDDDPYGGIT